MEEGTLSDPGALERALAGRLEAVARTGGELRAAEAADLRELPIDSVPLVLLGAGAAQARALVAHALAHWTVAGIVDNPRAGAVEAGLQGQGPVPVLGDAGLPDLLAREPRAVGVMCCGSDGSVDHFQRLWRPSGRPLLSLAQAMRRAGLVPPDHMGSPTGIAALLERRDLWQGFADEASRRCFLSVLLYRLSGDLRWLDPIRLPYRDMYFFTDALDIGMEAIGAEEVLVDGGAFDGDTVAAFAERTGGRHRHIHAFEADPANLGPLHARVAGIPRVTVHPVGLWSHAEVLRFSSGHGPGGRLGEGGDVTVPVRALDELGLAGTDAPTLIKLDIEGAEIPALRGAARTIGTFRPRLTVAVYHALEDFAAIPDLIESLRPGSRYRLRHHSPLHHDTVLYVE